MVIQRKNFWLFLVLSIVTCGIYSYYFIYKATEEINAMSQGDGDDTNPATAVILSIVTCGFYILYWYYKQGNRIQFAGSRYGLRINENGLSYLMWFIIGSFICGFGVYIAIYMFLTNFNKVADAFNYNNAQYANQQNYTQTQY